MLSAWPADRGAGERVRIARLREGNHRTDEVRLETPPARERSGAIEPMVDDQ